ncbi:MAG: DUF1573 domain-containing protein [Calditrichia bacterium]
MKPFHTVVILIVLLLPLLLFSQELKLLTPSVLDLGTVPSDTVASGVIRFQNVGEKPLTISKVETSCGCTMAGMDKMTYDPGEEGQIRIDFNTKGYSGVVRKTATIHLEEGNPSRIRVVIQARVTPKIELEPRFIDFQQIALSQSVVAKSFLIRNNMKKELVIENLKVNNDHLLVEPKRFRIPPGGTQNVIVKYKPYKMGRDDTVILLEIKEPSEIQQRLPVFVNVLPEEMLK